MKIIFIPFLFFLLSFFLSSCTFFREDPLEELRPSVPTLYNQALLMLTNMESFKANATVSYISNRNINVYETIQIGKSSGHYLIEVVAPENLAGNITASNTIEIYQFNKNLGLTIYLGQAETKERTSVLITNFIYYYLNLENVSHTENEDMVEFTVVLNYSNPYIYKQTLIVNAHLKPVSLITYDINGEPRIIVEYGEFFHNIPIDVEIFSPS